MRSIHLICSLLLCAGKVSAISEPLPPSEIQFFNSRVSQDLQYKSALRGEDKESHRRLMEFFSPYSPREIEEDSLSLQKSTVKGLESVDTLGVGVLEKLLNKYKDPLLGIQEAHDNGYQCPLLTANADFPLAMFVKRASVAKFYLSLKKQDFATAAEDVVHQIDYAKSLRDCRSLLGHAISRAALGSAAKSFRLLRATSPEAARSVSAQVEVVQWESWKTSLLQIFAFETIDFNQKLEDANRVGRWQVLEKIWGVDSSADKDDVLWRLLLSVVFILQNILLLLNCCFHLLTLALNL